MSSGYKRSYDAGDSHSRDAVERRDKPRDWRDAFLDDDERRERPRSREREADRSRGHDGRRDGFSAARRDGRGSRADRDRDADARWGRPGGADCGGAERRPHDYRDREQGRGGRDRDERDRYRHDYRDRRPLNNDREEGEVDSPPRGAPGAARDPPRNGPAAAVPTQPRRHETERAEPRPAAAVQIVEPEPEPEPEDPEKILEERRRKREAILAKYKDKPAAPAQSSPAPSAHADLSGAESATDAGLQTGARTGAETSATSLLRALGTRSVTAQTIPGTPAGREPSLAPTPMGNDFDLSKQAGSTDVVGATTAGEAVSAADYDPSRDGQADQQRVHGSQARAVADGVGEPAVVEDEYEEVDVEVEDEDEDFDMFAAFSGAEPAKKKRTVKVRRLKGSTAPVATKQTVLDVVDNLDDTEGYYRPTPGEIIDNGRYQVTISLGKGMFSGVVKAKVLKAVGQERRQDVVGKEVAIKMIRSQESMYVAGRKEVQILQKLNEADPEDKKHIVRLERTFEHRGHLCIVTESLSMNLRDVIKRFGKDVGLNMRAVRAYAHQMLLALSLMRKCGYVHADIKPDNILVSENKATLKVCDLGSAAEVSEGEVTPYLVSRFYRAPEIILGLPFDTAIDIWSVGCTLFELYTGKILFPGRSNNHMLYLMMDVKGKLPHRMIKKSTLGEMHFDENMNFVSVEKDKITGADVMKTTVINKATRDLRSRLLPPSSVQLKMKEDELKQLQQFIDLLEKCLMLDPARRISPREALLHPFISGA